MPLPPDIASILVDYWSFNQGGGAVVYGEHAGLPLVLGRGRMPCGCGELEPEEDWLNGSRDEAGTWATSPVTMPIDTCCCSMADEIELVHLRSTWTQQIGLKVVNELAAPVRVRRGVPWSFTILEKLYSWNGSGYDLIDTTPITWQMGPWDCADEHKLWRGAEREGVLRSDPSLILPHEFTGLFNSDRTLLTLPKATDAGGSNGLSGGALVRIMDYQIQASTCERFRLDAEFEVGGGSGVTGGSDITSELELRLYPANRELPVLDGWAVESRAGINATSGLWVYNGAGTVELGTPLPFSQDGDGATLQVRFTRNWIQPESVPCWAPSIEADPEDVPETQSDVLAIGGRTGVQGLRVPKGVTLGNLAQVAPAGGDVCCGLSLVQTPGGISGETLDDEQVFLLPSISVAPHEFVLTIVRDSANPRVGEGYIGYAEAWVDGTKLEVSGGGGGTRLYIASLPTLNRFQFGDLVESFGAIRSAALWRRRLDDEEIPSTGGPELEEQQDEGQIGPGGGGGGKSHPWLNADGSLRLIPSSCVLSFAGVSLASEGPHGRQTRRVHERKGRRYRLEFKEREGGMIAILREGLAAYRGGAISARWRHPTDDPPGSVASAPRWRILGVSGLERTAGGVLGSVELELEEV